MYRPEWKKFDIIFSIGSGIVHKKIILVIHRIISVTYRKLYNFVGKNRYIDYNI